MKSINFKRVIGLSLLIVALVTGCRKDDVTPVPEEIPQATDVNKFIYYGLQDYYLWTSNVANLNDTKYANADSLNAYLNGYEDPQDLFTSLLYQYKTIDKWSFMVDDSQEIDDWISGISESMGYDFMLGRIGDSDNLFGFVRYVYAGSPAEKAGLKRGDIFLKVNSTQLTVSNYQELLFSTLSYTLSFAKITDYTIAAIDKTMSMTAVVLQENPINKDTIFTVNNQKIGYLVYNGFNSDFDIELNNVFLRYKEANISQLVVDLRYNGGGSVTSSIYLASMIYSTDVNKVFAKSVYNTAFQKALTDYYGSTYLFDNFTNTIEATDDTPAATINSLSLKKVYFIVSDNTASASELLINGLRPYIDVKVVGINTVGKYTGSTTIKDWDEDGEVNPSHKYAMQPIVVKYANSAGVSDFVDGLTPDIVAEEDIANLLPFGDPNETLLKVVLDDLKGIQVTAQTLKSAKIGIEKIAGSRDFKPFKNEMYINSPRKLVKN